MLKAEFGDNPLEVYSNFRCSSDLWLKPSSLVLLRTTRRAIYSLNLRIIFENVWRSRQTISATSLNGAKGLARRGRGLNKKEFPLRRRLPSSMNTL